MYIINKCRAAENIEDNHGLKAPPVKGRGSSFTDQELQNQIQYDAERSKRGMVTEEERATWKKTEYNPEKQS